LNGQTADDLFKNKIVLLGFVNENINDIEDKHFTPFNEKFAGKSTPDMNGVVIHANIISMILDGNYINKVPGWLNWLITILIAWVNVAYFVKYFIDSHIWFHLAAKIVQLLSFVFFVYLSIAFYDKFSIRFDVKIASFAIILAVDIIYFYEALAVWLHQKHNFKTIFHKPHH
ncbi:MAG: CHASE2 domain-containing protein, partial [Sphingobacteriales bacterium]